MALGSGLKLYAKISVREKGSALTGRPQSCVPTPFAFPLPLCYFLRFLWSFVTQRAGKEEPPRGTLLRCSFPPRGLSNSREYAFSNNSTNACWLDTLWCAKRWPSE